jgi:hypothetical protein
MSVQISYKKQILFGLIFVILILFVLELIIHAYDFFTKTCKFTKNADAFEHLDLQTKLQICYDFQDLNWGLVPYPYLEPNQHMPTININSDAFRGKEIQPHSNEKFRIFIVGASTIFGSGSTSDETTIPGYLQQMFDNSTNVNVEIINAGIPGAHSTNELNLIKNKLINYKPDLIVVYDGWNDLRDSLSSLKQTSTVKNSTLFDDFTNTIWYSISKYRTIQVIQKFTYYSQDTDWEHRVIYEHNYDEIHKKIKIWESNMNEICNSSDFQSLIILQPISGSSNRTSTEFESMKYLQNDGKNMNNSLNLYSEKLQKLNCKNTADFTNVFDNVDGPIFYDEGHVTDRGNLIIAKKLFELLATNIS